MGKGKVAGRYGNKGELACARTALIPNWGLNGSNKPDGRSNFCFFLLSAIFFYTHKSEN